MFDFHQLLYKHAGKPVICILGKKWSPTRKQTKKTFCRFNFHTSTCRFFHSVVLLKRQENTWISHKTAQHTVQCSTGLPCSLQEPYPHRSLWACHSVGAGISEAWVLRSWRWLRSGFVCAALPMQAGTALCSFPTNVQKNSSFFPCKSF